MLKSEYPGILLAVMFVLWWAKNRLQKVFLQIFEIFELFVAPYDNKIVSTKSRFGVFIQSVVSGREAKLENVDAWKNALQRCGFPMQKTEKKKLAPIKSYMLFPDAYFSGTIPTWTQCIGTTKMVQSFWKRDISMNFWHIRIPFFRVARPRSQKASFSIFEFFWRFGRQVWEYTPMLESGPEMASPGQWVCQSQNQIFWNALHGNVSAKRTLTAARVPLFF